MDEVLKAINLVKAFVSSSLATMDLGGGGEENDEIYNTFFQDI